MGGNNYTYLQVTMAIFQNRCFAGFKTVSSDNIFRVYLYSSKYNVLLQYEQLTSRYSVHHEY